jgi:branched-chain amino acid transport system permease protein
MPRSALLRYTVTAVIAMAVLYGVTSAVDPYRDLQIAQVAYLACAAAGLTVLTGLSGQISLGQGAFMAIGAYTAALLLNDQRWPLVVVLLAAIATSAVAGVVVGMAAARLRGPYLAGATLALAIGVPELADYGRFTHLLGGQNGLTITPTAPPLGLGATFPLERWQAWIACLATVVMMWLLANLTGGGFGRTLRAVRDDEIAAALAGIRVGRARTLAFVVAAACAGLGGGLLAIVTTLAAPGAFPLTLSLQLVTAIILGGLGSLAGAVWGSLILVLVPSWADDAAQSANLPHNVAANLPLAIYGLVLIAVMLVFPGGVQGGLRRLLGFATTRPGTTRPQGGPDEPANASVTGGVDRPGSGRRRMRWQR